MCELCYLCGCSQDGWTTTLTTLDAHDRQPPEPKTRQYEQADILNRVGVRLLEASAGEDGWEVRQVLFIYNACMYICGYF